MVATLIERPASCVRLEAQEKEVPAWAKGADAPFLDGLSAITRYHEIVARASCDQGLTAFVIGLSVYAAYGEEGQRALDDLVEFIRVRCPKAEIFFE